jgi:hypothetical protein
VAALLTVTSNNPVNFFFQADLFLTGIFQPLDLAEALRPTESATS